MGGFHSVTCGGRFLYGMRCVTSHFDVIFMYQNNVLAKFVDTISIFFYTYSLILCVNALNINYQHSKLGYRRKLQSTLRRNSS